MTPGSYLQRRRTVAGFSISSLARELLHAEHFGQPRFLSDQRRVELRMLDAEAGARVLAPSQVKTLAKFAPLDPAIYRDLVEYAELRAAAPTYRLCRSCAASDSVPTRAPFSGIPGTALGWAAHDLCEACDAIDAKRLPSAADHAFPGGSARADLIIATFAGES